MLDVQMNAGEMLPGLLIHIGYHKTGTTWLQEELFTPNSTTFQPIGSGGRAMSVAKSFVQDQNGHPRSPFASPASRVAQELQNLLSVAPLDGRVPVISHERLSGYPHSGGYDAKTIADALHECFPEARVWCVIREQKSMVASLYHHYLKNGGTDRLEQYLTRKFDGKRPGYSAEHIRYTPLVTYYQTLFGAENVLVQPYEQFKEDPAEFMETLGRFLKRNIDTSGLEFRKQRNRHEDYSIVRRFPALNAIARQSSLNGHSPFYLALFDRLFKNRVYRRRREFLRLGRSAEYSDDYRMRIEKLVGNTYGASNKRLEEITGIDLKQYGYDLTTEPNRASDEQLVRAL